MDLFFYDLNVFGFFQRSEAFGVEGSFEATFAHGVVQFHEGHGDFRLEIKALAWRYVSDSIGLAFLGKGNIHFLDSERELIVDTGYFLTLLKHSVFFVESGKGCNYGVP